MFRQKCDYEDAKGWIGAGSGNSKMYADQSVADRPQSVIEVNDLKDVEDESGDQSRRQVQVQTGREGKQSEASIEHQL